MRAAAVWAVAMVACTSPAPATDGPSEQPAPVPPVEAEPGPPGPLERLVGVVAHGGTEVCSSDGAERRWINIVHEVGFVPVFGDARVERELEAQLGRPVVVTGRRTETGPAPREPVPADAEACPPAQMRSDWVMGPTGTRMRRGPGLGWAGFAVETVEPFKGLRGRRNGQKLQVELENTLGVALAITMQVHYEGCYKKPGGFAEPIELPSALAPGAVHEATIELYREREGRGAQRTFRADSVELRAQSEGLAFELDAPLSGLGIESVTCPDRRKR